MNTRRPWPGRCNTLSGVVATACVGLLSAASSTVVSAHHAARAIYHMDQIIEVEGEITGLLWRNPHLRMTVTASDPQTGAVEWDVESIPIARLTRVGVSAETFAVGQTVTLAGHPSRRSDTAMYVINLLLPDGREVLLDTPVARWSDNTVGTGSDFTPGTRSADPSLGVFRVWSTDGSRLRSEGDLPLTEAALTAQAAYDPLSSDNPFTGCTPKGMPGTMNQPNPVDIVNEGNRILIRLEEYDTRRIVSMEADAATDDVPSSRLGRSVGHWEGDTLVVETDRIDAQFFNQDGLFQSDAMTLVERFAPSADGARLDYTLTVTDPALFLEPTTLTKSWIWVPGDRVQPFDCAEG